MNVFCVCNGSNETGEYGNIGKVERRDARIHEICLSVFESSRFHEFLLQQ